MRSLFGPSVAFARALASSAVDARSCLVATLGVAACAERVVAHGGAGGDVAAHTLLGVSAFFGGVAIVGVAVALDARDAIASKHADVGVRAGGVLALVGLGVYVVV